MLFQEVAACAALPSSPASSLVLLSTSQDPVLLPHRLVWEGETNTNTTRKIVFILFWYFHSHFTFIFYVGLACRFMEEHLLKQQIFMQAID